MGSFFAKLWNKLSHSGKEYRVTMIGLDGAGKTTLLYKMKLNEEVHTIPTIGFNVETVEHKNIKFTCWDVGGQSKIRPLWNHYFTNTDAVIFVVDSADVDRISDIDPGNTETVEYELRRILSCQELDKAVLLVLANKQDVKNALHVDTIRNRIGLDKLRNRRWYIQGTDAITGRGIDIAFDWLVNTMKSKNDGK